MENAYDGSQMVQPEMAPGQSFDYKLIFPDPGIYWYHPHVNESYGQALGLYGAFIVTPRDEDYFPPVNREIPLFLSDIPMKSEGPDVNKKVTTHTLMGQYGILMLVNGEEEYTLDAQPGETLRFFIVNAANARPFKFGVAGLPMKLIGGDNGAYEQAQMVESIILGPSERAIVDVFIAQPGMYVMENRLPDRTQQLGMIQVQNEKVETSYEKEFLTLQNNPAITESIEPFKKYFDQAPDKKITLGIAMGEGIMSQMNTHMHMMPDGSMMGNDGNMMTPSPDGIEWEDTGTMMNSMSTADMTAWYIQDDETGKKNMDIEWILKKDQPIKIRIFNDPQSIHLMQHPIHFHGQRFLVVARNGVFQNNLVWKDTTLVVAGETVDIILDPSNPGDWMAHCHISEHLASGMMFGFRVEE
jgi:FtsP/CotA-like multicopper oxidase with cupredoxin domain